MITIFEKFKKNRKIYWFIPTDGRLRESLEKIVYLIEWSDDANLENIISDLEETIKERNVDYIYLTFDIWREQFGIVEYDGPYTEEEEQQIAIQFKDFVYMGMVNIEDLNMEMNAKKYNL